MNPEFYKLIESHVGEQLSLLKPVDQSWQPSDFLPDFSSKHWDDEIKELQNRAVNLPDAALVVLTGNIVTEEALPSYQTWLNRVDSVGDPSGASQNPWAQWSRGWTAEENRHGELLFRYLYLSGRVDMRAVEITVQNLIKNGFDIKSGSDLCRSLVYVSFQERATKISHANTGRLAEKGGDVVLARICVQIAADEARHEEAYKRFFAKALELEPNECMIAFAEMLRRQIAMPARLMKDATDRDLFAQFVTVAQTSGVYTARDYAEVIEHLVAYWNIPNIKNLSAEGAQAQEYVSTLAKRFYDKADRFDAIAKRAPKRPCSWIHDREI